MAQRRAVDPAQRERAARAVAGAIGATRWLAPGKRIGLYASMPQELGTGPRVAYLTEGEWSGSGEPVR